MILIKQEQNNNWIVNITPTWLSGHSDLSIYRVLSNMYYHSGPENFKKSKQKKFVKSNKAKHFFREIAFLVVLNFFPVQKLIFSHFEIAKNGIWPNKKFREIDLFDFTSFLVWTFLNFLSHCV